MIMSKLTLLLCTTSDQLTDFQRNSLNSTIMQGKNMNDFKYEQVPVVFSRPTNEINCPQFLGYYRSH